MKLPSLKEGEEEEEIEEKSKYGSEDVVKEVGTGSLVVHSTGRILRLVVREMVREMVRGG